MFAYHIIAIAMCYVRTLSNIIELINCRKSSSDGVSTPVAVGVIEGVFTFMNKCTCAIVLNSSL